MSLVRSAAMGETRAGSAYRSTGVVRLSSFPRAVPCSALILSGILHCHRLLEALSTGAAPREWAQAKLVGAEGGLWVNPTVLSSPALSCGCSASPAEGSCRVWAWSASFGSCSIRLSAVFACSPGGGCGGSRSQPPEFHPGFPPAPGRAYCRARFPCPDVPGDATRTTQIRRIGNRWKTKRHRWRTSGSG